MQGSPDKLRLGAKSFRGLGKCGTQAAKARIRRGQTLTEYSLILALIVLVVVATLTLLSDVVGETLWSNKIENSFTGATNP